MTETVTEGNDVYPQILTGRVSWRTADTDESIPARNNGVRETFPVYFLCPDGNAIYEDNYNGDGFFGGEHAYELLAQWNCSEKCTGGPLDRKLGIDIDFGHVDLLKYPIKIARHPYNYNGIGPSPHCEYQGFYYEPEEIDEDKLIAEVENRVAGIFESEIYYEMLDELAEKVEWELECDLKWENIPGGKVYDIVEDYMRPIWSVIR